MGDLEFRIKKARKHVSLTQPQLAALIGVSHRSLTSYEKNASKITVQIAQKIAIECKVNFTWLLTGQGEMVESIIDSTKKESSSNSNLCQIVIEHQEIIKRFKDPVLGKTINEQLVVIQDENNIFKGIVGSIKSAFDTVEAIKEAKLGNSSAPDSKPFLKDRRKKQRPLKRGENEKDGTHDQ